MSTDFKMPSVASKFLFYRPEHKANGAKPGNVILKFLGCKDEINQQI